MDIEKAKKELKTRIDHYKQFLNSQMWVETDIEAVKVLLNELDKKDKRLKRQEKLINKRNKEIEELKQDNAKQWEERCRLTFELQEAEERLSQIELQILKED